MGEIERARPAPQVTDDLRAKLGFMIRFGFVGASTAAILLGLTIAFVEIVNLQSTVGSSLACLGALTYNYLLHYHWTFESEAPHGEALLRYLLMCAFAMMLNATVMYLGAEVMGYPYVAVQVIAMLVLVSCSITMSSIWVFRD